METGIVFANVPGGVVGAIVAGQLHRAGLEIQPHARFDEFLARPVVLRIEGELQQLSVGLNQPGILEFAQLPGVAQPGRDVGFGLGLEFRIVEPGLQILAALFAERLQTVELIQRRAVNPFPLGRL